jgi:eukaryotic-like serine/threonine-protein kinase
VNRKADGTVLSKRYELRDQLGAGGMAEVFLGRDKVLGRKVAVKTLLGQYAGDPHFIERFRREAQHAAALNHPQIVSVYDTGSDDGTHYIVMEYVDGKTLREIVREEGPLLPERVAEIGADVCAGLAYAHEHGIVHRDVKPANIMVTASGAVKVADFGIARAVSSDTVTQTAMVLGTAQYFSPEQAQSAPVDARSDIYSLGVVLYEMLTRQVPFTGSSPVAIAYKHVKEAPVLPSRLNPDVPASLEAIVMKALAKNPDNRYQSAGEMREDLLRALHGRPVEATPVLSDSTGMISPLSDETIVLERRGVPLVRGVQTPEGRRRRTGLILLGIIILAIIGVAIWALLGIIGTSKILPVPNVVGLSLGQAQQRLTELKFNVVIADPEHSDKYAVGKVIRTDPPGGTKLQQGKTVTITGSSGPLLVKMPDLVGKSEAQARELIRKAGLQLGKISRQSDERVARGRVISQSPSSGAFVQGATKVDLVISSGKPLVAVPDVTGFSESDARNTLENRNLKVQVVRESQLTCTQPVGYVCRQDPQGGSQVAEGSTVTIFVASEDTQPSSPPPSFFPSESPTPTETPT